ncbi:centrosomal protein of 135 kDa isoform X2 [Belonocnema kinseyi]|uniref:centrosomal protein of 135 kDa isoform X2 n=1 Tax=Belonocnema kinseyi TaxID=2817044 RepID=UPI00143D6A63|nr:centrosomal protein of 135 kDa isoform X2 [Belonocnema kinseyi]
MSAENEFSLAARYRTVRKHLDGLGYKPILPLDALPLVENLLADLIQTTDSLKHFKSVAQDKIESCIQVQLAGDPYKCDNARLVQENKELHFELLREKQAHQKQLADLKKSLRKIELERSDLHLASSRNLQRIKDIESQSANKSKKILELQGKCSKPVINNACLATKKRTCNPLRRLVSESDSLPRTKSSSVSLPTAKKVDPQVVDSVAMADHRMNCLNRELALKEKEISRLREILEDGRPYSAVSKDCFCKNSEKSYSLRNYCEGIDSTILQQAKCDLERQLKDALNKQHEAMSQALKLAERNEELEKELRDIDHIALAVEADCNTTVKENNRRVCRLQEKLEDVMSQVHALESELIEERRRAQELKSDMDTSKLEKLDLQRILESTLEEKKRLTDRINQLTANASNNRKSSLSSSRQCNNTKTNNRDFNEEEEIVKEDNRQISTDIQRILYEKESTILSLQNKLSDLEAERDYFRTEYNKFRDQYNKQSNNDNATMDRLERERDLARGDVERLVEERDVLRERLKMATESHTFEQRGLRESLLDLETRLEHTERERQELLVTQGTRRGTINGLEDQLDDMKEELKQTKQELADQRTQYFQMRSLQDQTDQALGDVQGQLSQSEAELSKAIDRNKNMEQQQVQLDNQVKELKQEINTLRASMTQIDQEKDQLLMILDKKTERIAALERELQSKEQQAMDKEQQIQELQHINQICVNQSAEQERQVHSMQIEMDNLHRQLTSSSIDRENAIQENRRLQDDLAAVTCELRNLQRELDVCRTESFDVKRQLQTYVSEVRRAEDLLIRKENERTEMLNHFRSLSLEATVLENSNHSLETEAAEARGALQSARDRLMDLEHQVADKDCLIRGYETQIADLTQSVASLETQIRQQENQRERAEADLNAVRDLCVKLDQQKDNLVQQLGDKDSLKLQIESQVNRLRTENAMVQDQMNRDHAAIGRLEELLDQARQESINTQTSNQELQNEISRLKQKIADLQSRLSSELAELRRYQNQAAEYNKQISELRRQVTNERFDRARKDEETRSRQFSPRAGWNHSTTRYFQLTPGVNRISPRIPAWMANRFGGRTFNCECAKCSTLRKSPFSPCEDQSTVCVLQIPGENQQAIRVQIVDMTPENVIGSFNRIEEDSEEKSKEAELKEKQLRENTFKDKELWKKKFKEKDLRDNELRKIELNKKELEEEKLKEKAISAKELGTKEKLRSSKEEERSFAKATLLFVKDSSVQTTESESQNQTEKYFESLAERILQSLQNLEEQPQIRRDMSTEPHILNFEPNFLSVESRSIGTDYWERTFPYLESRGVQSAEIFSFRPFGTNSTATSHLCRTTSGYSSSSQKTWNSPGRFARRLEKEEHCFCCGSEGTSGSGQSFRNFEDNRKVKNDKEKKKVPSSPISDVARPEFVKVLLEIGKYTCSLERQLAKMNESLKTSREIGVASRSDERNALIIPDRSRSKEDRKLVSEGEKEDSNARTALTPKRENMRPMGTSTPKSSEPNDEQIWVSLPVYAESEIEDWVPQHKQNFPGEEGAQNVQIQSETEDFDEDRIQKTNLRSFMATFGSDNQSQNISAQEEEESLLIINPPVASSTPNLEGEVPPATKNSLNASRTTTFLVLNSRTGGQVSDLKKSFVSEKNKTSPFSNPGPPVETQSSNSRINAATSTSPECLGILTPTGNNQNQTISGRNSKSSVRSLKGTTRQTFSISSHRLGSLDSTQYIDY